MSRSPYFSILMPLYNHERFVGSAVQSVLDQSFDDYELVICDDGSTDTSFDVVSGFSDSRINIVRRKNGGTTSALNSCLLASRGRYICWLSSDDLFAPTKLETHFVFHQKESSARFSIAPYGWIAGSDVVARPQKSPIPVMRLLEFLDGSYINGLSVCAERALYVERGGFNHAYRYAQDIEQWFAMLKTISPFFLPGDPQSFSRKGTSTLPDSNVLGHLDGIRLYFKTIVFEGFPGFIPAAEENSLTDAVAIDRLIDLCASPSNYFARFGIVEVFWSALKTYAFARPAFMASFESILLTKERARTNSVDVSKFAIWWRSSATPITIDPQDVLGVYLRLLDGIKDQQIRNVFKGYLARIV